MSEMHSACKRGENCASCEIIILKLPANLTRPDPLSQTVKLVLEKRRGPRIR